MSPEGESSFSPLVQKAVTVTPEEALLKDRQMGMVTVRGPVLELQIWYCFPLCLIISLNSLFLLGHFLYEHVVDQGVSHFAMSGSHLRIMLECKLGWQLELYIFLISSLMRLGNGFLLWLLEILP